IGRRHLDHTGRIRGRQRHSRPVGHRRVGRARGRREHRRRGRAGHRLPRRRVRSGRRRRRRRFEHHRERRRGRSRRVVRRRRRRRRGVPQHTHQWRRRKWRRRSRRDRVHLTREDCMASNKPISLGPVALTTTLTTNIFNPPTLTGGVNAPPNSTNTFLVLRHIRITNKTGSAATASLWLGGTGGNVAGTEFAFQGVSVPANSYVDWYGVKRVDTSQFVVGGS